MQEFVVRAWDRHMLFTRRPGGVRGEVDTVPRMAARAAAGPTGGRRSSLTVGRQVTWGRHVFYHAS